MKRHLLGSLPAAALALTLLAAPLSLATGCGKKADPAPAPAPGPDKRLRTPNDPPKPAPGPDKRLRTPNDPPSMETHNPPQNQQAARELPPALPKGLTPAEARAQAGDVETLIVKLTPPQMASARVETGSLDLGFVRLVVSVSGATPPAPEMRVLRADGSEIAAYGPAGKVAALRGEPAAWEFFFINDPMASGGEAALEFVTR